MKEKNEIKIFYVEDDEDDFIIFKHILSEIKNSKYKIEWTSNYEDAVLKLDDKRECKKYDIFILDYKLGVEHNALDLKDIIRANGYNQPIIVFTGFSELDMSINLIKEGISDYLIKGEINPSVLERSIRYSLERRKLEIELKHKKSLLHAILNTISVGVCLVDEDGNIKEYNNALIDMFDIKDIKKIENFDNNFKFKKYNSIYNFNSSDFCLIDILNEKKQPIEGRFVSSNGIKLDCLVSCSRVFFTNGKECVYTLVTIVDITKQKMAEAKLIANSRVLEEKIENYGINNCSPEILLDMIEHELEKFKTIG